MAINYGDLISMETSTAITLCLMIYVLFKITFAATEDVTDQLLGSKIGFVDFYKQILLVFGEY